MLGEVARQWLRIGVTGFGGPPAHVALLRELVVERRAWIAAEDFEDATAACQLLPGPASTQLSIYCARRVAGPVGAIVGGLCFITPGILAVLALALVFLAGSPPHWIRGAGAGAGAAVAAVAIHAGLGIVRPAWERTSGGDRVRYAGYLATGAAAAALLGAVVVVVLLACGLAELTRRRLTDGALGAAIVPLAVATGGTLALAWTALKVGALSYGGGFVIVPLMQHDAVDVNHWMSDGQFANAVALGQVTPGPVTATVAAVGYAAHGVGGGLLAAAIAFSPSFAFILALGSRFDALRADRRARAFLDGAGPAAAGAILGAAVPLGLALRHGWQAPVLGAAAVALLVARRGVVEVLLGAGAVGVAASLLGAAA